MVNDVILQQLCVGVIEEDSREAYRQVIAGLAQRGAEGILLGCTEIGLLIRRGDADVPLFDSARLHAERAVDLALGPHAGVAQSACT
jgi:aspartate racemase